MTTESCKPIVESAVTVLNSVKKSAPVSLEQASETLEYMGVAPHFRVSLDHFADSIGLTKRSLYRVIRFYQSKGVSYSAIPKGFKGVHEKRKRLMKGRTRLKHG